MGIQEISTILETDRSGLPRKMSSICSTGEPLSVVFNRATSLHRDICPRLDESDRPALLSVIAEADRALRPCSPVDVAMVMAKFLANYQNHGLTREVLEPKIEIMEEGLSDIPKAVLHAAAMDVMKASRYFPNVADVRAYAAPRIAEIRKTAAMAKRLIDRMDQPE